MRWLGFLLMFCLLCQPVLARTPIKIIDHDYLQKASAEVSHQHYKSAYKHFKIMAHAGCPYSQCILGIMHLKGVGVSRNDGKAFGWFQKSASQGFADAERYVGHAYNEGLGVAKNPQLAEKYLASAAQHGIVEAKVELAHLLSLSNIPADVERARKMLSATEIAAGRSLNQISEEVQYSPYSMSNDNAYIGGIKSGISNIAKSWNGYAAVARSLQKVLGKAASAHPLDK